MAQAGLVRIGRASHQTLRQLAEWMGESMQAVAEKAIEELRRQQMFAEAEIEYTNLRREPELWADEAAERDLWANTLMDGLSIEEVLRKEGSPVSG